MSLSSKMEQAVTFGNDQSLVGILGIPKKIKKQNDLGIIFLNAGLLHHVGPFRMNVEFCRKLAKEGYISLRFDCSAIGDSGRVSKNDDYLSQVRKDVISAMDMLESRQGCSRYVLIGLCTGADHAHRAMVADQRVVGGIFLGGYSYPSFKFRLKRYLPILLSVKRINGLIARLSKKCAKQPDIVNQEVSTFTWTLPPKNEVEKEFKKLLNRGAQIFYIFSGGENRAYNYKKQYYDSMPFLKKHKDQFKVFLNLKADHTYCLQEDRDLLYIQISSCIQLCER